MYNALYSKKTQSIPKRKRGKAIDRYYYLNIEKALDPGADDEEIVISVSTSKQITSDFWSEGRCGSFRTEIRNTN